MKNLILLFIFILSFFSCCRKNKDTKCTLKIIPFSESIASYDFKEGSNWTFKLKDSVKTGLIHFQSSYCSSITLKSYGKNATPCDSFGRFAYNELTLRDNLSPNKNNFFTYYLCDNVMCLNRLTDRGYGTQVYAWNYYLTDTTFYGSNFTPTKVYQEKIIDTVTILNKLYKDVHQVYYYPGYSGFKRVWWCPGVGFLKLERIIPTTNQTEIWELQSHNAVL